jgi:hypothetical protein
MMSDVTERFRSWYLDWHEAAQRIMDMAATESDAEAYERLKVRLKKLGYQALDNSGHLERDMLSSILRHVEPRTK